MGKTSLSKPEHPVTGTPMDLYSLDDYQLTTYLSELTGLQLLETEMELPGLRARAAAQTTKVLWEITRRGEEDIELWREARGNKLFVPAYQRPPLPYDDALSRAMDNVTARLRDALPHTEEEEIS